MAFKGINGWKKSGFEKKIAEEIGLKKKLGKLKRDKK